MKVSAPEIELRETVWSADLRLYEKDELRLL